MRSGYDCWGTGERHTLICAYGEHIRLADRECPEWSGKEGGQGWIERDNRSEKHWFLTRCESTWEETRCRDPVRGKSEMEKWRNRCRKSVACFLFHLYISNPSIYPFTHPPTSQSVLSASQGVIRGVSGIVQALNALNKAVGNLCFLRSKKPHQSTTAYPL